MLDRLFTIFQLFIFIIFIFFVILGISKIIKNQEKNLDNQNKISEQIDDLNNNFTYGTQNNQ